MKKYTILAAIAAMTCGSVFAQDKATETNTANGSEKVEVPASVEMLQVAGQLLKYGYENKEALPLIQAADIYKSIGIGTLEGQTKTQETTDNRQGEAGTKSSAVTFDIDKILADAAEFADEDETYLSLINQLKQSSTRGATRNYGVHHDKVNAHTTDTYTISFRGGERACVVVSGDGDTDLDLYVYDENGNLVASDTDSTDDCVAVWNPRWTGPFTIKIKNLGRVYNRYSMAVN